MKNVNALTLNPKRAGEIAQRNKRLPGKFKDLSSIPVPHTHKNNNNSNKINNNNNNPKNLCREYYKNL